MHVLMGPFCMRESLDCTNGLSACLKAASLIQWACFGSKMVSVIQTETALSAAICLSAPHCLGCPRQIYARDVIIKILSVLHGLQALL